MENGLIIKIVSAEATMKVTVSEMLKQAARIFDSEFFNDFDSFRSSLSKESECIAVIDCTEKYFEWQEVLARIKDYDENLYTIIIVSENERETIGRILEAGAYDVITKGSLSMIGRSVIRLIPFLDDRKKLKELSHEKYLADHIVNNSRSMISIINRSYCYEKVNKTFCLNHNSPDGNFVGMTLEDVWGRENFRSNIKKHIDTCFSGKVVYYQAFFKTPAWGKRYYEVIFKPITDKKGVVTHALAETYDVTDLKLREQAVSEIEWEFSNLETNLPIGFFRSDKNGKLLHVNKAFLRIMDMKSEEEAIGKSISSFYCEKDLFSHHRKTIIEEGRSSFGRVSLLSAEEREVFCRISAFVVRDGSGNMIYLDGAIEDYTREVELEKQLLQSKKLDTIGLLAGGIAHDFNTILTTIYGYSEMSLEGLKQGTEAYSNIRKIVQAVGRARTLTNQMLTFSRQVGQEKISVRVADIILETTDFMRPTIPAGIELKEEIKAPDAYVSADPTQLYRVFLNLIKNAIEAIDERIGSITVSLDVISSDKIKSEILNNKPLPEYAVISFTDNGQGMDKSMTERIFEPFFSANKGGKGTGLGLSVVYGIISEVDGDINVKSKKGEGTTIEVYIPVAERPSLNDKASPSKANILIVPATDNEAKVISIALTNSGYNVKSTDPVGQWIKMTRDADVIIVLDNLRDTNTTEIAFELEKNSVDKCLLLISDFDSWMAEEKNLPSGSGRTNLFKPVSLKEIIFSLDSLLNNRS
jgi:PAS domain S-box-containing protein